MAKNLLAMCLVLLVASSVVYEVQGTFLLKLYLRKKILKRAIEFTPFACKGMLMLVGNMEHQCPATAHFKKFFTTFKSFMSFINTVSVSSSTNIDGELNSKANELFKCTSELDQSKSSEFKSTIMSMAKVLIDQKRKGSQRMTFREKRNLIWSMVKWTKTVVSFVSTAAEKSGKAIDVSSFGLDVDDKSIGGGSDDNSSSGSESDSGSASSTRQGSSDDDTSSKGNDSDENTPTPSTGKGSNTETKTGSETSTKTGNSDTSYKGNDNANTPSTGTGSFTGKGSNTETKTENADTSSKGNDNDDTPSTGKGSNTETKTGGSATYSNDKTTSKGKETGNGYSGSGSGGNTETTTSGNESKFSSKTKQTSGGAYSTNAAEGTTTTGGNSNSNYGANTNSGTGTKTGGTTETATGSSTTTVKEVETKTSSEVMSFISNLEKKYTGNAELKVFFDKLKASMSESSKLSSSNSNDFISRMKSAVGKLSDAMMFVGSRFSKSAKEKSEMESCQEQMIKTLKELQDVKSKIVSQSQGKTVSSRQQTELQQTITKWEQVTTQFVETAASSSSSSSSSTSSSQTQKSSGMNA